MVLCILKFETVLFGRVRKIKKKKRLISSCLSVCPFRRNAKSRLPRRTGFFMKFHVCLFFSKICRESSSFIEI